MRRKLLGNPLRILAIICPVLFFLNFVTPAFLQNASATPPHPPNPNPSTLATAQTPNLGPDTQKPQPQQILNPALNLGPNLAQIPTSGTERAGAKPGDHSTVLLAISDGGPTQFLCSGAVIAPGVVLTAAHCFSRGDHWARTGDIFFFNGTVTRISDTAVAHGPDLALASFEPSRYAGPYAEITAEAPELGETLRICGAREQGVADDLEDGIVDLAGAQIFCGSTRVGDYSAFASGIGAGVPDESMDKFESYHLGPRITQISWAEGWALYTTSLTNSQGDSGGPVFDRSGRIVAVSTGGDSIGETVTLLGSAAPWLRTHGIAIGHLSLPARTTNPFATRGLRVSQVRRIAGANRVLTSVDVFRPGPRVVLTTGKDAADGLAATSLAGALGSGVGTGSAGAAAAAGGAAVAGEAAAAGGAAAASVLLTMSPGGGLEPEVLAALSDAAVREVYVVGGRVRLSAADKAALEGKRVEVLAGTDRFATAVAVAEKVVALRGTARPQGHFFGIFVADGLGFADALVAGRIAAADGDVLLLTAGEAMPAATRQALERFRALPKAQVNAIGGPASRALESAGLMHQAYIGDDRYETANLCASLQGTREGAPLAVVTGANFPDAITGGAWAATHGARLVLADPHLRQARADYAITFDWHIGADASPAEAVLFGGPSVVPDDFLRYFGATY